MKLFKKSLVFVLVAAALCCVSVFAEETTVTNVPEVTITAEEYAEVSGVYTITVSAESDIALKTFSALLSFDNTAADLFDYDYAEVTDPMGNSDYFTDNEPYYVEILDKLTLVPVVLEKDTVNNRTGIYVSAYTTSNRSAHSDGNVFCLYLKPKSGKTLADANVRLEGADTAFESILTANGGTGNKKFGTGVYALDTANANYFSTAGEITVKAFWDKVTYTITVPANSNVYFADGRVIGYAEETVVEVPEMAGYIVVNTGLNTKHTVYSISAKGEPTEDKELADALFNTGKSGIRSPSSASDERQGLRFLSTIADDAAALDKVVEFGYMVTAETEKMNFTEGYLLNKALVDAGKAKMTVARNKADDISIIYGHDVNEEKTLFTTVAYGMPKTQEGYTTVIASRPYYKLSDGTIIYGEVTRKTLYDVAKAVKDAADQTDYNNNKAYIDEIISTVEGTTPSLEAGDVFVDVSDLLG